MDCDMDCSAPIASVRFSHVTTLPVVVTDENHMHTHGKRQRTLPSSLCGSYVARDRDMGMAVSVPLHAALSMGVSPPVTTPVAAAAAATTSLCASSFDPPAARFPSFSRAATPTPPPLSSIAVRCAHSSPSPATTTIVPATSSLVSSLYASQFVPTATSLNPSDSTQSCCVLPSFRSNLPSETVALPFPVHVPPPSSHPLASVLLHPGPGQAMAVVLEGKDSVDHSLPSISCGSALSPTAPAPSSALMSPLAHYNEWDNGWSMST